MNEMKTDRHNSKDYSLTIYLVLLFMLSAFLILKFMGYLQFLGV